MYWLIIVILIILAFVFLRMSHQKHKIFLIFFILILLFLYVTGSRLLAEQNINWKSVAGVEKATRVYFAWLGGAFSNLKTITANAVKMDWTQKNRTETAARLIEEQEK